MAKRHGDQLRRGDRVVASADIPRVPSGTRGRVLMVNGFRWIRYWVLFENGVKVGSLDGSQLTRTDKSWRPVAAGG